MATQDLIAAMIAQLGTAQPERDDPRRDPAWAPLDDRDTDALLDSLRALAKLVRHYPDDPEGAPPGDWQTFLPSQGAAALDALAAATGGRVAPHHALLLAFLRRLARPQAMATMLASALALSVGTVLMKGLRGIDLFTQQGWMAMASVLPVLALSLWLEPGALATLPNASALAWFGAIYAAFASSLLGHGLYYRLVQRHPVAQVTPWLLLVPVFAIALGVAFWGDRPGPRVLLGGAMVLGGVLAIALRAGVRQRTLPPAEEL